MILEKPLATSIRDAYRICEAFDRNPVPLVVPHSLRYLSSYRKAKELVDSGVLGSILHIHAIEQVDDHHTVEYYRRGSNMYRSNTTALLAKSSHDIDLINFLRLWRCAFYGPASSGSSFPCRRAADRSCRCVRGCVSRD